MYWGKDEITLCFVMESFHSTWDPVTDFPQWDKKRKISWNHPNIIHHTVSLHTFLCTHNIPPFIMTINCFVPHFLFFKHLPALFLKSLWIPINHDFFLVFPLSPFALPLCVCCEIWLSFLVIYLTKSSRFYSLSTRCSFLYHQFWRPKDKKWLIIMQ